MGMMVSWMLVAAAVGAFSITALSGCVLIPLLHRLHFGQTIRESGPTWHNKKQGTPTMGGLMFIFGTAVMVAALSWPDFENGILGGAFVFLFALVFGIIGYIDDYFKVKKQAESFEQDLQQKDQEMYDLKHDLIDAQIQAEKLTQENEELKQQIRKLEEDMDNLLKE